MTKMPHRFMRRPRDERGWLIPGQHTLSFHIYLALKRGEKPAQIAKTLGLKRQSVAVLAWAIRHPDIKAATQGDYYRNARALKDMAKEHE